MARTGLALALGLAGTSVPAFSQANPAPLDVGISVGVTHRRLVEHTAAGGRLLTETGPLLRLGFEREFRIMGHGALRLEAAAASGKLHYESTAPALSLRTGTRDLALGLAWRPVAQGRWGAPWLLLQGLQQRRQISSSGAIVGPHETSTLLMAGLRWTADFDAAGWRWSPSIEGRASLRHRLDVDLHGVFDSTSFDAGRRRDLRLALGVGRAGSPWSVEANWTTTRQSASDSHPLYRAGVAAGNVRHPRITIDDVGVGLRRAF
jgi:hypothetical protein